MPFLCLPIEIRLAIYEELFGQGTACVDGGRQDTGKESQSPSILPHVICQGRSQQRSAQVLRTCRVILEEARPILYDNTIFRTFFQAFAGRLPVQMTASHPAAPHVRHLEWQLNCDMLKKYKIEDAHIGSEDVQSLQSFRITCQAANWRGPICSEWCDKEIFVRGRQYVLDFTKLLQCNMSKGSRPVYLIEDAGSLNKGRVVLRLSQNRDALRANETIIE